MKTLLALLALTADAKELKIEALKEREKGM